LTIISLNLEANKALQISSGDKPKTLAVQNLSTVTIYLISEHDNDSTDARVIPPDGEYINWYAKGNYFLLSTVAITDKSVKVEEN